MLARLSTTFPLVFFALIFSAEAADDSLRGFVSVEPFEVRLEAIVRVAAFREAWRLGDDPVTQSDQTQILENITTLFESGVVLASEGTPLAFPHRVVRFIVPDPVQGYVGDDRSVIPLDEALVGLTFSADVAAVRRLDINWGWFAPGQERLVLEIASRGRPAARYVTREQPEVQWELESEDELETPSLLPVPAPEWERSAPLRALLFPGFAMLIGAAVMVVRHQRKTPPWVSWLTLLGIACIAVALHVRSVRLVGIDGKDKEEIAHSLLRNIYHAFDFRDEGAVYDTLESSVAGPLLERVYLEIRQSLELESSGGPRVRVNEIALREIDSVHEPSVGGEAEPAMRLKAEWATIGEITHWGHTHERTNRYEAVFDLDALPAGGKEQKWKVVGLELINEERMQTISRRNVSPEEPPARGGGASKPKSSPEI